MIWLNVTIGAFLIIVTILAHSMVTRYVLHLAKKRQSHEHTKLKWPKEFWIALIVLMIFAASLLESSLWAIVYKQLSTFQTFESALYFSIVTFTTLGYGDITLNEQWRLLASIEAATGIIIFGWSTALIMAAVQRLYSKK